MNQNQVRKTAKSVISEFKRIDKLVSGFRKKEKKEIERARNNLYRKLDLLNDRRKRLLKELSKVQEACANNHFGLNYCQDCGFNDRPRADHGNEAHM